MHSCRVFAINSEGRGPEANDSFTTLQDGKYMFRACVVNTEGVLIQQSQMDHRGTLLSIL